MDTHECEKDDLRGFVAATHGTDDGNDEFAKGHGHRAVDEERASAKSLDSPEGDGC